MNVNSDNLRFIMGFKLKQFRMENGLSLKELAEKTNLSISYLSEIEKGKKYPKPEKILQLAGALGVTFDELVSLQVNKELDPLPVIFSSPVIKEFPFRMYGFSPQDLLSLITGDPGKAGAFIRTLLEIGQEYDMRVEHLLFAALRSYQQMHQNYFDDIETVVVKFRQENDWPEAPPLDAERLKTFLIDTYNYEVDMTTLDSDPDLSDLHYVFVDGENPRLLVNNKLPEAQKKVIFGREIGYQYLALKERANSSSWANLESFDQLVNNFKANYFSGALLIHRDLLCEELGQFLREPRWNESALLALIERFNVAPETFLHRVGELLPQFFGIKNFLFYRITNTPGSDNFEMGKVFNMSSLSFPNGIGSKENYCRRWMALKLLKNLTEEHHKGVTRKQLLVGAQRSRFIDSDIEVFTITMARPSTVEVGKNASGTISFVIDDTFKHTFTFWNDPAIPVVEVNETCERCGLSEAQCQDRAASPAIFEKQEKLKHQQQALKQLIDTVK